MRRVGGAVSPRTVRCDTQLTSSLSLTSAAPATLLSIVVQGRSKHHNYQHARYYRYKNKMGLQQMFYHAPWYLRGTVPERHVEYAHELEAFTNFTLPALDARRDPQYEVATTSLEQLQPWQRFYQIHALIRQRWRVEDQRKALDKLKLALMGAEAFVEHLRLSGISFDTVDTEDQNQFIQMALAVGGIAKRIVHDHPSAVAGVLRVVDLFDSVGLTQERDAQLRSAKDLVKQMENPQRGFSTARDQPGGTGLEQLPFVPRHTYQMRSPEESDKMVQMLWVHKIPKTGEMAGRMGKRKSLT